MHGLDRDALDQSFQMHHIYIMIYTYKCVSYRSRLSLSGAMCGSRERLAALKICDLELANALARVHERDLADLAATVVEGTAAHSSPRLTYKDRQRGVRYKGSELIHHPTAASVESQHAAVGEGLEAGSGHGAKGPVGSLVGDECERCDHLERAVRNAVRSLHLRQVLIRFEHDLQAA